MRCSDCKMRKVYRFNLFKRDKTRPRFYIVHCGLCADKNDNADNCKYFRKK